MAVVEYAANKAQPSWVCDRDEPLSEQPTVHQLLAGGDSVRVSTERGALFVSFAARRLLLL